MQLSPGEIVDGRFEVECMVGEGGLAEVYRVRHRELGRIMALKLLTWRKKSLMERLVLEGRIQAQLDHPNIVSVLDLVRHDGQVGLLMEYVDAENLHDHIQRVGATPQAQALELLAPILGAVDAAHSVGITHRDLKPGNIMLARVGTGIVPKVADFGIAKVVQEVSTDVGHQTRAGSAMGTPGYLAPEQVQDASTIDARADVFALGAIAYEVITGRPAFADADGHVAVTATATLEPVPIQDRAEVSPCVIEALEGALRKDLDARTPTVDALAERLLNSRPDLLAAFRSHQVKPLNLSLAPADTTPPTGTAPPPSQETVDLGHAPAPTIAPPPLPGPTTEASMPPATASGWVVAGVLGTLLVLLLVLGGAGAIYVSSSGSDAPAGPTATVAPVPAPSAPRPTAAPVPPPPSMPGEGIADADAAPAAPRAVEAPPKEPPVAIDRAVEATAAAPGPVDDPTGAPDGTGEAPEVAPAQPVVIEVPSVAPSTEAPPEPTPAAAEVVVPPPAPSYPALSGTWSGKAGGQRMSLDLARSGGTVTGTFTLYAGAQVRKESVNGTVRPDGSLSFTAGDMAFTGTATEGSLSGSYMRQGAKKSLPWSAAQ